MPVIRARNHIEEYAARAKYFPPSAMASRVSTEASLAVAREILSMIGTLPSGSVLDVGCGDGALLSLLSGPRIGISPSPEEVAKLRSLWPGVRFEVASAQSLPLADATISTLICNSVLLTLENESEVSRALAEFLRVCQPGALIFLGEIPTEPVQSKYSHDSIPSWLWSLLTHGGPKNFVAGIRDVVKAATTETPLLFYPERWFHAPREEFVALCSNFGMELASDRVSPHAPKRRDYLFVKRDGG